MKSKNCSRRLTLADAIEIWKRRTTGEAVHVLASYFSVNPGRISDVLYGRLFPEAKRLAGI